MRVNRTATAAGAFVVLAGVIAAAVETPTGDSYTPTPRPGVSASTCAELVDQLLERDGHVGLMHCTDEGAVPTSPTPSYEEWLDARDSWIPVELGSRLINGREACVPDTDTDPVVGPAPSLYAEYFGAPGNGFKFEFQTVGSGETTTVVSPSPTLTTDFAPGATYRWRVRAVQHTGWSIWCTFTVKG
ncbi:hypothetical protein ACTI_47660 [Actinoplanes sp. OR16]|uniref:hypothetical protein n=1 Tax=Actinoplanes sp. OR16 TaxID=946334 RepID=UPI000F6B7EBA|nr:hypothetical protein [Actinoplanes sp. OR16]BBH68081.1 hypothetical protein ACTI_47660 [Actinoplanes sp. OR16]